MNDEHSEHSSPVSVTDIWSNSAGTVRAFSLSSGGQLT